MDRQSFTLKWTAIGGDVVLEIPRNHLAGRDKKLAKEPGTDVECSGFSPQIHRAMVAKFSKAM